MKEIKIEKGAILDEVVEELIKERENGKHVFVVFDDVKLYSDNVTLDSAYQDVCGCTKEEYDCMYDHSEAFNGMKEMFAVSKENVINNVKWSKLLYLTKDGKCYCPLAEEYLENMAKYTVYCKPEKADTWNKKLRYFVYGAGRIEDDRLLEELEVYELVGKIMENIANNKTWKEIRKEIGKIFSFTLELTAHYMLEYSPYGVEYCENIIFKGDNVYTEQLEEKYEKEKKSRQKTKRTTR